MTFSGNIKESKPPTMKGTWESELGYGWSSRRCRAHRPPESTMSVSSDIRFTRRKLSRSCRGCCAALAALLVLLLLAAVAVYLGRWYHYNCLFHMRAHRPPESTMSVSSDIRFTRRKLSRSCRGCCAALAALLVLLLLAAVAVYLGRWYHYNCLFHMRAHRPPESTMSVSSDIRFTRRKLSRSCRGCCAALAALLVLLLLAAVAVYLGRWYHYNCLFHMRAHRPPESTMSVSSDIRFTRRKLSRSCRGCCAALAALLVLLLLAAVAVYLRRWYHYNCLFHMRAHRPPESTMSVSSDIRFTRRKLSRSCRGCCAALAALLVLLLLAAVAVYLGRWYHYNCLFHMRAHRPPESTMSVSSDIRFTRRKLSRSCRGCCAALAALLVLLLLAAVAVYLGRWYHYNCLFHMRAHRPPESTMSVSSDIRFMRRKLSRSCRGCCAALAALLVLLLLAAVAVYLGRWYHYNCLFHMRAHRPPESTMSVSSDIRFTRRKLSRSCRGCCAALAALLVLLLLAAVAVYLGRWYHYNCLFHMRAHRPPESTMSVSSDIRFTRRKLSRSCRGCCAALAALLVLLLLAAVAVYLGRWYHYNCLFHMRAHRPPESTMSVSSDIRFMRRKLSRSCRGCCAALAALLVLLLLAAVAVYLGRWYHYNCLFHMRAHRPPESTMSVSSDIRFTRRKLSRSCRGCCAALAALLVLLLLAAVAVYLGRWYHYNCLFHMRAHRPPESTMSVSSDIRFTRRKLSRSCRGCCAALAALLVLLLLAAVAVYLGRWYHYNCLFHMRAHRPPESTMSVSSDIRFTRRKLSRSCRGCCAALAALLVLLLLAAVAVYLGHMYLFGDPLNRQTFRGSFVASAWTEDERDAAPELRGNRTRDVQLRQALYDTYARSDLRSSFVAAEILALDDVEEGTRVHFEVSFEPIFTAVSTAEVTAVMTRELLAPYFTSLGVLPETLHIEESSIISSQALKEGDAPVTEITTTEALSLEIEELRECSPLTLSLCAHLPYNSTTFPNLVGHSNRDALLRDLVAFRELLDAECSRLAQDFVCQMLQPRCEEERLVRPCRAYCRAFHAGCGARLPDRLRPHFDCARFPDYFGPGSCAPEPDCVGGLRRAALSRRACDAVPDCADAADERGCAHCAEAGPDALRCALQPRCVPRHLRCDGTPDCADGSDEAGCLWVARSLAAWRRETAESALGAVRARAGYALWAERGRAGKLCAAPHHADPRALMSLATSLCTALTFKGAVSAEAVPDSEEEVDEDTTEDSLPARARPDAPEYVQVVDPSATEITFVKTDCPERKVIKIVCDQLECGVAPARGAARGVGGLPRSARPGDWPWHAALLRAHVHACDAALVHPAWLLTTASCFQGQPKAEWTARLGGVRIQSTTPWQQERRIVGMVRSPVEGSMLAMVRLEEPVEMTDFVRPACLPEDGFKTDEQSICNTLGWTRNRDQLQRVHVVPTAMNTCENVSIATGNGICAEPLYDQDDCDEEEYAGSSMMCFDEKSERWSLIGVSGWRIACSKIGLGRPRIYDAVTSHIEWIRRTIANSSR